MDKLASFKLSIIVLMLLSLGTTELFANPQMYRTAREVLKTYRIDASEIQMDVERLDNGTQILVLQIEARRNNFDMALLAGFIAGGTAVNRARNTNITGIRVIVNVPYRDQMTIEASSPIQKVKELLAGGVKPEVFMRDSVIFT